MSVDLGEVIFREATVADIPAIVELWLELVQLHAELDDVFTMNADAPRLYGEFVQRVLSNRVGGFVAVVEIAGQLVGFCLAQHNATLRLFQISHYGDIVDFTITKKYRRCGLGGQLFQFVDGWFKKNKIDYVELRASVFNEQSKAFWRKMGFNPTLCVMNKKG